MGIGPKELEQNNEKFETAHWLWSGLVLYQIGQQTSIQWAFTSSGYQEVHELLGSQAEFEGLFQMGPVEGRLSEKLLKESVSLISTSCCSISKIRSVIANC